MEVSSHAQHGWVPLDAFEKWSGRKLGTGWDSEIWLIARWTALCVCTRSGNGRVLGEILW